MTQLQSKYMKHEHENKNKTRCDALCLMLQTDNSLNLMQHYFPVYWKNIVVIIVSNTAIRSSNTNRELQPKSDEKSKSFLTL